MSYSGETIKRVVIQEAILVSVIRGAADFIDRYYLTPSLQFLQNSSYQRSAQTTDGQIDFYWVISSEFIAKAGGRAPFTPLSVRLSIGPVNVVVEFTGADFNDPKNNEVCVRVADDIEQVLTSFLGRAKRTSLYFIFSPGESMVAPSQSTDGVRRTLLKRIFAGNAMNLYLIIIALSYLLIFLLGVYSVIVLLAIQAVVLIFSDVLVLGAGNVRITRDRPEVTIVSVLCTPEIMKSLARHRHSLVQEIRKELEKQIPVVVNSPEARAVIQKILTQSGVTCAQEDIAIKTRNPYSIVLAAAAKFHLPAPKITIVNVPIDNASATGVSPGRSSITITTGALEDLNDEELEMVVGHELGHVRGHDPAILFSVTSLLYLGGLFVWLPILLDLGLFYFIIAFGFIYLVGKILETRADTVSATVLGKPGILAAALTNIGFRQLYSERYSSGVRLFDWLRFDPHPPIYFRVQRLSKIDRTRVRIRHALLVSIRDCILGFLGALVGSS